MLIMALIIQSFCGAVVLSEFPHDYRPQIINRVKVWRISKPIQHIYSWLLKQFCIFFEQWKGAQTCWKFGSSGGLRFDNLGIKYL